MFRTPSRTTRVATTGIAAAALAVTLGACSSSTSGSPSSHGSIHLPSHDRPTPSAPAHPSSPTQSPSAQTVALKSRLLDAADIGGGFHPIASDGSIEALPCTMGAVRPYKKAAGVARAAFLDAKRTAQIDEEILQFPSAGAAELAYDTEMAGYGCGSTRLEDGTLTIVGPTDIRSAITANNVPQADAWNLTLNGDKAIITVVRMGATLVKLHFLSDGKATPTVDPQQVIQSAIAKTISGS